MPELKLIQPLVLVVDDDEAVGEALQTLLAPRLEPLYQVETAGCAADAIELVEGKDSDEGEVPVALIISDEKMPDRSGTDLLIALRDHPLHRDGGRIVITGYAGLESAKKAINQAEVDQYLPKPWDAQNKLLPAVGAILARFAQRRGLDQLLLGSARPGSGDLEPVYAVRRAWSEYLIFLGQVPFDDGDDDEEDEEEPQVEEPGDAEATHFLVRRLSPREDQPVGSLRLRALEEGEGLLDCLAFIPEEAGEELESLLLRLGALEARVQGLSRVRVAAPVRRRGVYEGVGFADAEHAEKTPAGTAWMALDLEALLPAGERAPATLQARYQGEQRLCSCMQSGCRDRDYAAERRSFLCPLDLREGRVPDEFPRQEAGA